MLNLVLDLVLDLFLADTGLDPAALYGHVGLVAPEQRLYIIRHLLGSLLPGCLVPCSFKRKDHQEGS